MNTTASLSSIMFQPITGRAKPYLRATPSVQILFGEFSATSRSPPTTLSLSMFCFVFRVADMSPSGGCWLYVNRMVFASQMLCRFLGSSLWFPGPCFSGVGFVVFFGPCGACGSAVLFGPMWGVWFCCFIWPHVGRLVLVAVGVLNPYS